MNQKHKTKPDGLNAHQVILFSTKEDLKVVGNGFMTPELSVFIMYNYKGELFDVITEMPVNERE